MAGGGSRLRLRQADGARRRGSRLHGRRRSGRRVVPASAEDAGRDRRLLPTHGTDRSDDTRQHRPDGTRIARTPLPLGARTARGTDGPANGRDPRRRRAAVATRCCASGPRYACGRPVVAGPVEATAIGNVLVQMIGLGLIGDLSQARAVVRESFEVRTFEPTEPGRWDEAVSAVPRAV